MVDLQTAIKGLLAESDKPQDEADRTDLMVHGLHVIKALTAETQKVSDETLLLLNDESRQIAITLFASLIMDPTGSTLIAMAKEYAKS